MTKNKNKPLINESENIILQIIKVRNNKEMTQFDLANKSGTKQSNISRLESGNYNPTLEFLTKVAEALDMTLKVEIIEKAKEESCVN